MPIGEEATRLERTVERLRAYRDAGADCLFAPGVYERETIVKLVEAVAAPLNILMTPQCPSLAELEKMGVARGSAGSAVMRAALRVVRQIGKEMLEPRPAGTLLAGAFPSAVLADGLGRRNHCQESEK